MSEHSFPGRRSRIRGANVVWVSEVVGGRSGITRAVGVNPMLLHQDAFTSVSTCNRSNENTLGMKWLALFQPFKIVRWYDKKRMALLSLTRQVVNVEVSVGRR